MPNDNVKFNNVIIASGPVIIKNNQVLLNKHGEKDIWKFPGGDITKAQGSLESWAQKKVQEEMGIEVNILRPLKPMAIWDKEEPIILIHYLAELISKNIKPAKYIKEHGWFDIDNLPPGCAPNIKPVIDEYKSFMANLK